MRLKLSDFIPLMALAAAIAMATAACDDNDGEETSALETATPPPATESGAPANETVPGEIESAARELLADKLNVDMGSFSLNGSESVQWSDASLGCPQEGMMYAQVITPGYKLVFDHASASFAVHTNSDGSHMVVCGDGQ